MTTQEIIKFAAQVQVGTEIKGYGGQILVVTKITETAFVGYSKYNYEKYGDNLEGLSLAFETLTNPHYNNCISIA